MAPYRPPGRSNRSGRTTADNDVFEGLPVKQWGQSFSRVSLAPPVVQAPKGQDDKWADPPMPRDFQLLQPWTQQLLRLARSGKVGTKRKQDPDCHDEEKPDDDGAEDSNKLRDNDRGYVMRRWKPVPESMLEPEHKHFQFLAKRRKGITSQQSAPDVPSAVVVAMRKTKVQKADANGEVTVYEALVPEGQTVLGEVTAATELADIKPVLAAPGTVIEGVGVANEDGVVVAEHLKPGSLRTKSHRKKNGGPGRGKKRVTFTNPDGSTFTTIVPNATKIVPEPGQTVKHVSKDQEATADVTAEQAAAAAAVPTNPDQATDGADEGSRSEDGEDDSDDDDREDGELSDEDAPRDSVTPAPATTVQQSEPTAAQPMEDVQPTVVIEPVVQQPAEEVVPTGLPEVPPPIAAPVEAAVVDIPMIDAVVPEEITTAPAVQPTEVELTGSDLTDPLSSPEKPLSRSSQSRQGSEAAPPAPTVAAVTEATSITEDVPVIEAIPPLQPPTASDESTPGEAVAAASSAEAQPEQPLKPPSELPVEPPIEASVESPLTEEPAVLEEPVAVAVAVGEEQGAMTETANALDSVATPKLEAESQIDALVVPPPAPEPASASEPSPLLATEPVNEPVDLPVEEPALQTELELATEPTSTLEAVADPAPEPFSLPASEPAPEPVSESVSELAPDLSTKPSTGNTPVVEVADVSEATPNDGAKSELPTEDAPPGPPTEADTETVAPQVSEAAPNSTLEPAPTPSAADPPTEPAPESEDDLLGDLEKHLASSKTET